MSARIEFMKDYMKKYYEADEEGRLALSREYMAHDYVCYEPPELPQGGVFRGWDAGARITAIYRDLWDLEMKSLDFHEATETDTLFMRAVYKWTSKKTGKSFEGPIVELVTFTPDNKIQAFEVYHFDPAGLVATLSA